MFKPESELGWIKIIGRPVGRVSKQLQFVSLFCTRPIRRFLNSSFTEIRRSFADSLTIQKHVFIEGKMIDDISRRRTV